MDTDRLNRWLTLVANLAVVAGIIFLAIEIRQNTLSNERQMLMERISGSMDPYFSSPELVEVWAKVKAVDGLEPVAAEYINRYNLTPEEAVLWSRLVHRGWYVQQAHFIVDAPSEDLATAIREFYHLYPDVRIVFDINEDSALNEDFVAYVESVIVVDQSD